ncbi:uncharacterized protein RHIMIDRAFT_234346 [Rhizopus microsporus ATCC 52813]|uniref:Uncharacterized protein n=1 Tax=Rhizopus microsporus ATCC 52813 TaxID=1340429 RepID=A0A2G4T6Y8_RHIZD|nr:uncharacterized protein RHIMIDRAFT_234346 [Rhizopus microsporus ATCC 52813]PHZ16751.1 hypothetical protein RHIMIDRAFT_234346 [Rhizopus microsporus ATCC 52813]
MDQVEGEEDRKEGDDESDEEDKKETRESSPLSSDGSYDESGQVSIYEEMLKERK